MKTNFLKIIIFILIVTGIVFWGFRYIFLSSNGPKSKAAGETIDLTFNPASFSGSAVNTDVTFKILAKPSKDAYIRGYEMKIDFDKTKLAFKSMQYLVGSVSSGLGDTDNQKTTINSLGQVKVIGESQLSTGSLVTTASGLDMMSFTFTVLQNSPTLVSISNPLFFTINPDSSLFKTWTFTKSDLSINGITATSTPEPTLTDVPNPTATNVPNPSVTAVPNPTVTIEPTLTPTTPPGQCVTHNLVSSNIVAGQNNNTVVTCNYGLTELNCVTAGVKVGANSSNCSFTGWSGNNALFSCNAERANVTSATCGTFTNTSANCCLTSNSILNEPTATDVPNPTATDVPNPTATPVPTISTGNVALNMKLKFQGIVKTPLAALNSMLVKVKIYKEGDLIPVEGNGTFTSEDKGIWSGKVNVNIASVGSGKYKILVKGSQHIQKKICDNSPTETDSGTYSCSVNALNLASGDNNLDFSNLTMLVGDLDQNGIVDSVDYALVRNNLGKTEVVTLAKADLNRDGTVDTQDFSLIIFALGVRVDEQ